MNILTDIVLDSHISNLITNFVFTRIRDFNFNGNARRFFPLNKKDNKIRGIIKEYSLECYSNLGIRYINEEPIFGNFVGVNQETGFVHKHTDPKNELGYHHVRLNFMVQKPNSGGNPVLDGIEYQIQENQSWINIADIWMHGSTPVVGSKNRIVLSLGNCVPPEDYETILKSLIY
jgi:hypothetical protein